jgi:hypothetical protein
MRRRQSVDKIPLLQLAELHIVLPELTHMTACRVIQSGANIVGTNLKARGAWRSVRRASGRCATTSRIAGEENAAHPC